MANAPSFTGLSAVLTAHLHRCSTRINKLRPPKPQVTGHLMPHCFLVPEIHHFDVDTREIGGNRQAIRCPPKLLIIRRRAVMRIGGYVLEEVAHDNLRLPVEGENFGSTAIVRIASMIGETGASACSSKVAMIAESGAPNRSL